jgi:CBS domain-containing protein
MATRKVLDERVAGTECEIPQHPRVEPLTVKTLLSRQTPKLYCVPASATAKEALQLMANHDVGAVLVLDGDSFVGVFSERSYIRSTIRSTQASTKSPADIPIREVIVSSDISVSLTDSVQTCLNLMSENHLRNLPVMEAGHPVALLSLEDFLGAMVAYLERVFKENEVDHRIAFLRGTYSC